MAGKIVRLGIHRRIKQTRDIDPAKRKGAVENLVKIYRKAKFLDEEERLGIVNAIEERLGDPEDVVRRSALAVLKKPYAFLEFGKGLFNRMVVNEIDKEDVILLLEIIEKAKEWSLKTPGGSSERIIILQEWLDKITWAAYLHAFEEEDLDILMVADSILKNLNTKGVSTYLDFLLKKTIRRLEEGTLEREPFPIGTQMCMYNLIEILKIREIPEELNTGEIIAKATKRLEPYELDYFYPIESKQAT